METKIDWDAVKFVLGTTESDPEAIVHELCHAYDCIGEKAFEGNIGGQLEVDRLMREKYPSVRSQDLSELRVSAMTLTVLAPWGLAEFDQVLTSLRSNVTSGFLGSIPWNDTSRSEKALRFEGAFRFSLGRDRVKKAAKKIAAFLKEFEV